jgi:hypothetical protein
MNEQESLDFSHGNPTLRQLLGSALSDEKEKKMLVIDETNLHLDDTALVDRILEEE